LYLSQGKLIESDYAWELFGEENGGLLTGDAAVNRDEKLREAGV
jgi:hypothetical protein